MQVINYLKRIDGDNILEHVGFHESGDYLLRGLFSINEKPFRSHKYETEKEYKIISSEEVNRLEKQTCPERLNSFHFERVKNIDYWQVMNNGDKVCSFCGSLHPDRVIEIIKEHGPGAIEPSTKYYKLYINRPNVRNACEGGIKYYRYHDTESFVNELTALIK